MKFNATIITLFPEMFPGPLGHSLAGRALEEGLWSLDTLYLRDFATDKHATVDDRTYGGGTGMVIKPDIMAAAIDAAYAKTPGATLVIPTPRGIPLTQALAAELVQKPLIIGCGRFEGIDQRIFDHYQPLEVSLGDFVLSGGEIAALAMLDACVRLIDGVISKDSALAEESFSFSAENGCLLEYPHYTRPPCWREMEVPAVLTSGNHQQIQEWRKSQAEDATRRRRPDLWARYERINKG